MSSVSMMDGAAEPGRAISWKFIVLWPLTFVVPWLLVSIVRTAVFHFAAEEAAYKAAVLLHILIWLLIAYLQIRLLRPFVHRRYLWLIATFVGGNLGTLAGSWVQFRTTTMLEMHAYESALVSDYNRIIPSDLMLAIAPVASISVGVLAGTALLGLLQSICVEGPLGNRILWLFASSLSGMVAGLAAYGANMAYGRIMFEVYPRAIITADIIPTFIVDSVGRVGGMIVYGLLTGAVLRRLLLRSAWRQKEAMIARFE
jgi:hypothetical protein